MPISKLLISFSNLKGVPLIPNYSLNINDIIIYKIYLPDFINLKSELDKFLSITEINRAERFHKELDKNQFIICRSILKIVLAAHTKLEAKNIQLDYNFNKKPYLASHPNLHFNVSHSEDYAVIAISQTKIGVDIESISESFDFTNLLPDIFIDDEILEIQNATNKKHAFYTSWTRKEALVKALGKGIDEDFKNIPCLDGEHNVDSNLFQTTENWQVYSFDLAEQYLAAVAFEGLSKISKNLVLFTIPNTIEGLLELSQIKKFN
jgi:4'-phosphopantetheinyl transferase